MSTEVLVQFTSEEEAEAFCSWQSRTRAEGVELSDHLTGDLLVPALEALDKAKFFRTDDDLGDLTESPFPFKLHFAPTAVARALSEYYPEIDTGTIELDPSLYELEPKHDVIQLVPSKHCVRPLVHFKDTKGRPFVGALQVAIFRVGDELVIQVDGQPANFKVLNESMPS